MTRISQIFTRIFICSVCAATTLLSTAAHAQSSANYPSKAVKIIVPFPPGGLADNLARGLSQELSREWGQQVVVENRAGANTIIAAQATLAAGGDGYTLMLANDPTISSNQYLYTKLPYDPVKDFVPVINVAETLEVMVVGPAFKGNTLNDLIAAAKAKPEEVAYGTYGLGSKAHIDAETFSKLAGIKTLHVPYKGVADVMPALLSGQVQFAITGVPPAIPLVRSGQLRAIAIASPKRSASLPEVPTFSEVGLQGFNASAWFGLIAPAATPRAVVEKIAADVSKVIVRPDFQQKYISGVGLELLNQGPAQFADFLRKDRAAYAAHIKELNVKLD
jgi:tripartite-type tricarboxylate transporter receptor subunit TctC